MREASEWRGGEESPRAARTPRGLLTCGVCISSATCQLCVHDDTYADLLYA